VVLPGISQDGDVSAIESVLEATGLPLEPTQQIGHDDST
jgi:hypothetical protein